MINFLFRFSAPLALAGLMLICGIDAAEAKHQKELTAAAECYEMLAGGLMGNVAQCDK